MNFIKLTDNIIIDKDELIDILIKSDDFAGKMYKVCLAYKNGIKHEYSVTSNSEKELSDTIQKALVGSSRQDKDIHWRDAKKELPPTNIELLGKSDRDHIGIIKVKKDRITFDFHVEHFFNLSIERLVKWAYIND